MTTARRTFPSGSSVTVITEVCTLQQHDLNLMRLVNRAQEPRRLGRSTRSNRKTAQMTGRAARVSQSQLQKHLNVKMPQRSSATSQHSAQYGAKTWHIWFDCLTGSNNKSCRPCCASTLHPAQAWPSFHNTSSSGKSFKLLLRLCMCLDRLPLLLTRGTPLPPSASGLLLRLLKSNTLGPSKC